MGSVSRMLRTGGRATSPVRPASCEAAYTGPSWNTANRLSPCDAAIRLELALAGSHRHISPRSGDCLMETNRAEPAFFCSRSTVDKPKMPTAITTTPARIARSGKPFDQLQGRHPWNSTLLALTLFFEQGNTLDWPTLRSRI